MTTPPLYDDILERSRRRQRGEAVEDRPGQYDDIVERSRERQAEAARAAQQGAISRARSIKRPASPTPMDRPVDPGSPASGGGMEWDDGRGFGTNLGRAAYDAALPRSAEFLGGAMQTVADALPQDGMLGMGAAPFRTGLRAVGRGLEEVGGRNRLAPNPVTSIADALESPANLRDYLGNALGEGLGSSLPTLAAAATGGLPAAALTSYGQMVGEVGQEFDEVDPTMARDTRAQATLGLAVPLAALDMATEVSSVLGAKRAITENLTDWLAARSGREIAGSIAKAGAKGAAMEGVTEGAQEGGQYFGTRGIAGKPMTLAEGLMRMGEGAVAGALPGGVMGAASRGAQELFGAAQRRGITDIPYEPIGGLLPGQSTPVAEEPDFEVFDDAADATEVPVTPAPPSAANPPRPGAVPQAPKPKRTPKAAPAAPAPMDLASALEAEAAPVPAMPDVDVPVVDVAFDEPDVMPTPDELTAAESRAAEVMGVAAAPVVQQEEPPAPVVPPAAPPLTIADALAPAPRAPESGTTPLPAAAPSAPSSEGAPLSANRPDDAPAASPAPAPAARDERPVAPVADAGGAPRVEPVLPGDGSAPGADARAGRDDTGAVAGRESAAGGSGGVAPDAAMLDRIRERVRAPRAAAGPLEPEMERAMLATREGREAYREASSSVASVSYNKKYDSTLVTFENGTTSTVSGKVTAEAAQQERREWMRRNNLPSPSAAWRAANPDVDIAALDAAPAEDVAPPAGSGVAPGGGLAMPDVSVEQYPSGRWGFAGARIPAELMYQQQDGSPITDEQYRAIRQAGPGFVKGIKRVTFDSKEAAEQALADVRAGETRQAAPTPATRDYAKASMGELNERRETLRQKKRAEGLSEAENAEYQSIRNELVRRLDEQKAEWKSADAAKKQAEIDAGQKAVRDNYRDMLYMSALPDANRAIAEGNPVEIENALDELVSAQRTMSERFNDRFENNRIREILSEYRPEAVAELDALVAGKEAAPAEPAPKENPVLSALTTLTETVKDLQATVEKLTPTEPENAPEPVRSESPVPPAADAGGVRPRVGGESALESAGGVRGAESERDAGDVGAREGSGGASDVRGADEGAGDAARGDAAPGRAARADEAPGARAGDGEPAGARAERDAEPVDADPADRITPKAAEDRPAVGNYRYSEDVSELLAGGPVTKVKNNFAAIKLAQQITGEDRKATRAEQEVLAKYVGWGPVAKFFKASGLTTSEQRYADEIRRLLPSADYAAARKATQNAYYTDPRVARRLYEMLARLGVRGGRFLEPSVGSGILIGTQPEAMAAGARWIASELDPTTAMIARLLYPESAVHTTGFEALVLPDNSIDVAVGNPPFGNIPVFDPKTPRFLTRQIHDYFFARSLAKVRPGGLIAYITSDGTLDKFSPTVREHLAKSADLVMAVRLPSGAFAEVSETMVTTDLIILRKREAGEASNGIGWTNVVDYVQDGETFQINEYYAARPDHMLGKLERGGMRSAEDQKLVLDGDEDLDARLGAMVARVPEGLYTPAAPKAPAAGKPLATSTAEPMVRLGSYQLEKGVVYERTPEGLVEAKIPKTQTEQVKRYIAIRDAYKATIALQRADAPAAQITKSIAALNAAYDAYVKAHGPFNKEVRTVMNKTDADGNPIVQVRRPNQQAADAEWALVSALEHYDHDAYEAKEPGAVRKAAALERRVIFPDPPVASADSPGDAMAVVLNETGRIDEARVAALLNIPEHTVEEALGELALRDPDTGRLEPRGTYLSGDVKDKLARAKAAAAQDARYVRNVQALEPVIPADIPAMLIPTRLGQAWIPESDYVAFFRAIFRGGATFRFTPELGRWSLDWDRSAERSLAATSDFGTERMAGPYILEALMGGKPIQVFDKDPEGKRVLNLEQTDLAITKGELLQERFQQWLMEDTARAARLERKYNDEFNRVVETEVDGSYLTTPGVAKTLDGTTPYQWLEHQKNGIARYISQGNMALVYGVGLGKTFTMAGIVMEARRLGLARRPMITYPNALGAQWPAEFQALYPGANILAANAQDLKDADSRQAFLARAQAGDFDAILVPESIFTLIRMSDDAYRAFYQEQLDEFERVLEEARERDGKKARSVKDIEAARDRLQVKLKELVNDERRAKDDLVTFEAMGVDLLLVDEVHRYKNLYFPTSRPEAAGSDSQRSTDFLLKTRYMHRVNPGRGLVLASGTIIANNVAPELYAMQKYLQPDTLAAYGIGHFDTWITQFANEKQELEQKASGAFDFVTKVDEWSGKKALQGLYRQVFDVQMADPDPEGPKRRGFTKMKRPPLLNGTPTLIETPSLPAVQRLMREIADTYKAMKGKPPKKGDPIVPTLAQWGLAGAIDMRLVDKDATDNPDSKLSVAAGVIADRWQQDAALKGTIIVFLDTQRSTNRGLEGFHTHVELMRKLHEEYGIPRSEMASVALAKNPAEKYAMIRAANAGKVRVIIGTTNLMGVGVNLQKRATRIVHLDIAWRPDELEQRNGRAIRQGHQLYNEGKIAGVEEIRFATAQSLDGFKWSKVRRKSAAITDMLRVDSPDRVQDVDMDGSAEEMAAIMAIASGNPYLTEQAQVARQIKRLEGIKRAEAQNALTQRRKLEGLQLNRPRLVTTLAARRADAAQAIDSLKGEAFTITIGKTAYTDRTEAAKALSTLIADSEDRARANIHAPIATIGTTGGGFPVTLLYQRGVGFTLVIEGEDEYRTTAFESAMAASGAGLLTRLENLYARIGEYADDAERALANVDQQIAELRGFTAGAFSKEEELKQLKARKEELGRLIIAESRSNDDAAKSAEDEAYDAIDDDEPGDYDEENERYAYTDPVAALIGMAYQRIKRIIADRDRDTDPLTRSQFADVEERLSKGEKGLPTLPWLEDARQRLAEIRSTFTRHFPELDTTKDEMHALAHELLLRAERSGSWSKAKAADQLLGVVQGLSPADVQLMQRYLAAYDIEKDLDAGLYDGGNPVPFYGRDEDGNALPLAEVRARLEQDLGVWEYQVGQNPTVKQAIDRREAMAKALTARLVEIDALPAAVLEDPRYFHRQVLSYAEARLRGEIGGNPSGAGTPREVRQRKRGFQKGRVGGSEFNLRYAEAEYEWVAQANQVLLLHDLLAAFKQMDQTASLKAQANALNIDRVYELAEAEQGVGRDDEAFEDPLAGFKQKIAMAKARIVKAIASGQLDVPPRFQRMAMQLLDAEAKGGRFAHPQWWAFLSDLAARVDPSNAHISALSIFKAVRDRKQFIQDALGRDYIDPTDVDALLELAGPEFAAWQPEKGNVFYSALTVAEKAIVNGTVGTLEGDALRRAMVMGGKKPTWILPRGIAATLDNLTPDKGASGNAFDALWTGVVKTWKAWTLLSPARLLKYNFNNAAGDLDAGMLAPKVLTHIPQASKDLWQYMKQRKLANAALVKELQEAIEHGVMDQGLTATEIPEIVDLPGFERLATASPLAFGTYIAGYWKHARLLTNYRENILRLAAWRYFKAEIAAGRAPLAASNRRRVELLRERPIERAALLARDLVGDYGNISVAGEVVRDRMMPFYSWMEVNAKRYVNFARNIPYEETGAVGNAGRLAASVGARLGLKGVEIAGSLGAKYVTAAALASAFLFLVAAFNAALHPDEWDELRATGRDGHLILGKTEDGTILTVRLEGALADFLGWLGMKDLPADLRDLARGKIDAGDMLEEAALAPIKKLVGALDPTWKSLFTFFTGRQTFPDPFNPRPARDPLGRPYGVFFDQWSVGWLYRQVLLPLGGVPAVPAAPVNPVAGLLLYQVDGGEVAYQATKAQVYAWLEKQGKEAPSILPTEKSTALYYWKQATKWGEAEAATAWLQRYYDLGGTRAGAKGSIERSAPLATLTERDRRRFVQSLSPVDRDRLARAEAWYKATMTASGRASLRQAREGRGRPTPPAAPSRPGLRETMRELSPISRMWSLSDSLMQASTRRP